MPTKGAKVYSVVKGADGKFKSVSKRGKSSKVLAAPQRVKRAPAKTAKAPVKRKRVATQAQLNALHKARAKRTYKRIKAGGVYGVGTLGGVALEGPAGPPSAVGDAVASLVGSGPSAADVEMARATAMMNKPIDAVEKARREAMMNRAF